MIVPRHWQKRAPRHADAESYADAESFLYSDLWDLLFWGQRVSDPDFEEQLIVATGLGEGRLNHWYVSAELMGCS